MSLCFPVPLSSIKYQNGSKRLSSNHGFFPVSAVIDYNDFLSGNISTFTRKLLVIFFAATMTKARGIGFNITYLLIYPPTLSSFS
jgi:hypothetical protein